MIDPVLGFFASMGSKLQKLWESVTVNYSRTTNFCIASDSCGRQGIVSAK
jgi:hypothetical protein